jgi:hypothetical protein
LSKLSSLLSSLFSPQYDWYVYVGTSRSFCNLAP